MATVITGSNGVTIQVGRERKTRNSNVQKVLTVTDINRQFVDVELTEEDIDVLVTLLRA